MILRTTVYGPRLALSDAGLFALRIFGSASKDHASRANYVVVMRGGHHREIDLDLAAVSLFVRTSCSGNTSTASAATRHSDDCWQARHADGPHAV